MSQIFVTNLFETNILSHKICKKKRLAQILFQIICNKNLKHKT